MIVLEVLGAVALAFAVVASGYIFIGARNVRRNPPQIV